MQTVPMSSVAEEWHTFPSTAATVGLLTVAAAICLLAFAFRWYDGQRRHWTSEAHDCVLALLAVATALALCRRLAVVRQAAEMAGVGQHTVYPTPACQMHVVCVSCTVALVAAALLKLSRLLWPDVASNPPWSTVAAVTGGIAASLYVGGVIPLLFDVVIVATVVAKMWSARPRVHIRRV